MTDQMKTRALTYTEMMNGLSISWRNYTRAVSKAPMSHWWLEAVGLI